MSKSTVWKFCENRDMIFELDREVGHFENEWLKLEGKKVTVFGSHLGGYAWDGCSVKWKFLDLYFGTPDGVVKKIYFTELNSDKQMIKDAYVYAPKTYFASMVHDILYQFKKEIPVSRKTADLIFLDMMQEQEFKLAKIYYHAVRLFGGLFGSWLTE